MQRTARWLARRIAGPGTGRPAPLSALRSPAYAALYSSGAPALGPAGALTAFNPIQTQASRLVC